MEKGQPRGDGTLFYHHLKAEGVGGGGGDVGVKGDMQRSGWRRKISPKK